MWGSQPWNQWALQPSMFNNVPHDEIDWAALAKQWIQMQQAPPAGESVPAQPPSMPVPPPQPPPLPPGDYVSEPAPPAPPPPPPPPRPPLLSEPYRTPLGDVRPPGVMPETGPSSYVPREPSSYWRHEWDVAPPGEVDDRMWVAAPTPDPAVPLLPAEKKTFDYGHVHDNPPLTMQTVDYNHVSNNFAYNPMYPPEDPYDQYWSQVASAPMMPPTFLKKDRVAPYPAEDETSHIDAAKRKQLPAWIREGLEKMEQERLKRLEKERAEKEKSERAKKALQGSPKKGLLISGGYESTAISVPTKSKFDSDSEHEDNEPDISTENRNNEDDSDVRPLKPVPRFASPVEDSRTDEEKQQELMLKVRRMLTEILLTVTNSEMYAVAREVYQKALAKASARPLASSGILRSIASGLGSLANYESHSEASESDEESSSSDEELRRRIQEKKQRFAAKERKVLAELKAAEEEEEEYRQQQIIRESSPPARSEKLNVDVDKNPSSDGQLNDQKPVHDKLSDMTAVKITEPTPVESYSTLNLPNSNHEVMSNVEIVSNSEKGGKAIQPKIKNHDKNSKSDSSSSDSESDSSSSSPKSSYSHSDRKGEMKGNHSKHSSKDNKKAKKHSSYSQSKHRVYKRNEDHSSDSSLKNSKYSYHKSDRNHAKKRMKDKQRDRSDSSESPHYRSSRSSRHLKSRSRKESFERRRDKSHSRERYSKRRSPSPRYSPLRSRHESSSSRRRDRDEGSRKYKDSRRFSESRSSSRTPPKRYKRNSRSASPERGRHYKKSKVRTRDR